MATIPMISLFVLSIQWLVFLIVAIGIYFAVKKNFSVHQKLLTSAAIVQIVFIAIMITVFLSRSGYPSIVYIHMIGGTLVALLVIYTVLSMNGLLPAKYIFPKDKQKLLMRITAFFWLFFVLSGSLVFTLTYVLA